ncbi:type IX secretion system protein PorG [Flavobacterium aurantiibacter]|uniref:DUF6089 domain-containing protein n=1 Tax=Flavobacterium aurantiibacter TaxID=2023067 RepID=A0A255ZJ18_9FLAO|nr:DUF6089 family protein [Flavobacterium aurantiibacter]OYQ41508.1 hypothetical protein CHX27_13070 [Flavobacterium aurantiibacter]
MKKIIFGLICLVFSTSATAQIHEIGLALGGSNYVGDIGPTDYFKPNKLAGGILYKWNKSPRHAWRASFTQTTLASNDRDSKVPSRRDRGYSFRTTTQELSLGLEFNFFPFDLHSLRPQLTPYIYSGLSAVRYDNQYFINGGTEYDKKELTMAIPMVVGVKANISPRWVLAAEIGARYTYTDNLDASNPDITNAVKFGNTNSNDWFMFSLLSLTYTFGNNPCFCPE